MRLSYASSLTSVSRSSAPAASRIIPLDKARLSSREGAPTASGPSWTAWPYDFNDDQKATLADVLRYIGKVNTSPPNLIYDKRFDLNASNSITLSDVLRFIGKVNTSCA